MEFDLQRSKELLRDGLSKHTNVFQEWILSRNPTACFANRPRFDPQVAILEYTIYHDIRRFRFYMGTAARGALEIFRRDNRDEGFWRFDNETHWSILYACAAGDFELALDIAFSMNKRMKGSNSWDFEFEGYALQGIVKGDQTQIDKWFPTLTYHAKTYSGRAKQRCQGFQMIMEAILKNDAGLAQAGLVKYVKGYVRCESDDPVRAFLCPTGIGLANLCRWHGVWVSGYTHMIPEDLLFTEDEIRERTKNLQPGVRPEGMPPDYWIKYPNDPEQIAMTAPFPDDYPEDPITNYMVPAKVKKIR